MTRNEAIKIYNDTMGFEYRTKEASEALSGRFMDALVALGILKLEEPKNKVERFLQMVSDIPLPERTPHAVYEATLAAGLRLVPADAGEG